MKESAGRRNLETSVVALAQNLDTGSVHQLWRKLLEEQDSAAREALIHHHMPVARMVAAISYGKRFNDEIEFEDYLQWATLGMIESLDRFDPSNGVQFKTFASDRMYGAVLDGIASATEKQEQIALRARLRRDRLNSIKQSAEEPLDAPLGHGVKTSQPVSMLCQLADVATGLALAWLLEDTGMVRVDETTADAHHIPYLQVLEIKQLQEQIRNLVDALPVQQQTVIRRHYMDEIPFEEIATQLGLGKSRISQIHKQALMRLKEGLNGQPKCNVAL